MRHETAKTVTARWTGSYYSAEVDGRGIASIDGDNWTDDANGAPVDSPAFREVSVTLVGGPRDGTTVA